MADNFKPVIDEIKSGGKSVPYMKPANALQWFWHDHPDGRIITHLLSADPIYFRAEIYVSDICVATGHADASGNTNQFRKIETAAVRRALAFAGYDAVNAVSRGLDTDKVRQDLGTGNKSRRVPNDKPPAPAAASASWLDNGASEITIAWLNTRGLNWKTAAYLLGITEADIPIRFDNGKAFCEAIVAAQKAQS